MVLRNKGPKLGYLIVPLMFPSHKKPARSLTLSSLHIAGSERFYKFFLSLFKKFSFRAFLGLFKKFSFRAFLGHIVQLILRKYRTLASRGSSFPSGLLSACFSSALRTSPYICAYVRNKAAIRQPGLLSMLSRPVT